MNCWHCREELIWQADHDYQDVYGAPNNGIITHLQCSNEECNAFVEIYLPLEDDNGKEKKHSS